MDVSVIIVSYNTSSLLRQCLQSIKEQTRGIEYEVIVVDNASGDDSVAMVTAEFPDVKVIESGSNLGFGKANNLGADSANGKYLFFLNSDTILRNNALKLFFDFAECTDEPIGALGCILTGADGKPCHSFGPFISIGNECRDLIARYLRFLKKSTFLNPERINQPKEVDYITGADLWVQQTVYQQTRGFDPAYFMYCEEVDWQRRMAVAGLKRIIIPGPEIIHLEGGSDPSKKQIWTFNRLQNIFASKKIYFRKHFHGIKYHFLRLLYITLQTPVLILLGIKDRRNFKLIFMQ